MSLRILIVATALAAMPVLTMPSRAQEARETETSVHNYVKRKGVHAHDYMKHRAAHVHHYMHHKIAHAHNYFHHEGAKARNWMDHH